MSDKEPISVPFVVYESAMEKADRQHRRLVTIIIILISLLFVSNALWLVAMNLKRY